MPRERRLLLQVFKSHRLLEMLDDRGIRSSVI